MNTLFATIYDRFLGQITDDLYVELTPEDTLKDLQNMLIRALPNFEFPHKNLNDYTISVQIKRKDEITEDDFVIGLAWHELDNISEDGELLPPPEETEQEFIIENSSFGFELTSEEINILAKLMLIEWVQRQVDSIENTRMKYSGTDFKMTSQANHLQKLLALLTESKLQSTHLQRLYNRRRLTSEGFYRSNWDTLGKGVYYDRYNN